MTDAVNCRMGIKKETQLRGRFKEEIDAAAAKYLASIPFDWRLYKYDIEGSIAHAEMLARQQIISRRDFTKISDGLLSIREEIESGRIEFKDDLEDIHMNIEDRLFEKIGDVAGKLHTARSRNDQVALDTRLYARDAVRASIKALLKLSSAIVKLADKTIVVIMPGYTHLQQAQPLLFSHHMMAYFEMFHRDIQRFEDCLKRINVLPLGSGALAGVPYPIDRKFVAQRLGFDSVSRNSVDAVSDRDFIIEYQAAASITMMHLSRLAGEIIMWSTKEFSFVEVGDAYATSSSIMPQKKNPDVAELARGKSGRVYGNLLAILAMMKGLPLSYNKDMQEDKEGFFDTVDTLNSSLDVVAGLMGSIKINARRMKQAIDSQVLATDLADYLVKKGLSFRQAHGIVSKIVSYALEAGRDLSELKLSDYRKFSGLFEKDVAEITLNQSVASRKSEGGTAPDQVKMNIKRAKYIIKEYESQKD